MNYYTSVLKKYAVFSGRASRKEFWMFVLFSAIITIILGILDGVLNLKGILGLVYGLAVLIPSLAVMVRRLHDTNRSGGWVFINLIPLIGAIIVLVFVVSDSTPGDNKYGPNPKEIKTV
jgi:uncharacterized membrane protein YhaH (DUF805 family)